MDLREAIERVKIEAESAYSSFHAGRRDDAEKYLGIVHADIHEWFGVAATPAGDVNETATSEKPAEEAAEKPAEVPGAVLPASQFVHPASAQQVGGSLTDEKPTQ